MSALRDGAATFWVPDGSGGWSRRVERGCRVDASEASSPAAVGPAPSPSMTVYLFGTAAPWAHPGCYCAAGDVAGPEPPADAHRVTRVRRYEVGGAPHHAEAVCG